GVAVGNEVVFRRFVEAAMLRQARCVGLGLFLSLVVFAPTAEAACAWVARQESGYASPSAIPGALAWVVHAAYSTERDCEQWRLAADADALKYGRYAEGRPFIVTPEGARQHWIRYVCLPDTVDPRGLKGGER